jgi:ketosteroid isomerase-like protein
LTHTTGEEPQNVALVRRFITAFNRLDMEGARMDVRPDVRLDEWPTGPDPRSYRGVEGMQQALDTWFEAWEWLTVEITEIQETGHAVFVAQYQRAKGRGSEVEVEITSYAVYTFRDGLIDRIQLFTEREPALAAAGLTPEKEEERR